MNVDSHHHLWDLGAIDYPWLMASREARFFGDPTPIQRNYLVEEFRAEAVSEGFEASVHIQVGASDPVAEAKWVQSVADLNPGWPVAQVAFCDLAAADAEARLNELACLPSVRGVRQIVGRAPGEDKRTGTNSLLSDPHFERGLKFAAEIGLSFDLQLTPELMRESAELFGRIPGLRVVLCHSGSPRDSSRRGWSRWAEGLSLLAEQPNIYCKLSGLGMFMHGWTDDDFAPFVARCLDEFGPARCMFGSNFPVDSLQSSYGRLVSAYRTLVPKDYHMQVFGLTAREFYRI